VASTTTCVLVVWGYFSSGPPCILSRFKIKSCEIILIWYKSIFLIWMLFLSRLTATIVTDVCKKCATPATPIRCLADSRWCDGVVHCNDGSDELVGCVTTLRKWSGVISKHRGTILNETNVIGGRHGVNSIFVNSNSTQFHLVNSNSNSTSNLSIPIPIPNRAIPIPIPMLTYNIVFWYILT
jgi:hypothetical protein